MAHLISNCSLGSLVRVPVKFIRSLGAFVILGFRGVLKSTPFVLAMCTSSTLNYNLTVFAALHCQSVVSRGGPQGLWVAFGKATERSDSLGSLRL